MTHSVTEGGKMLDCPFCGGKAALQTYRVDNPNEGYQGYEETCGHCTVCLARSTSVHRKFFNQISQSTIQQLRENHLLRVKEEEKYAEYLKRVDAEAMRFWNRRTTKEQG